MGKQWLNFLGFSLIFLAIILSSVVFGGYSSLHRSEGRIEITEELFLNACQSRLELLPQLLDYLQKSEEKEIYAKLRQTGKEAEIVLHQAISNKAPLDNSTILKIEKTQQALTKEIAIIFLKSDQTQNKQSAESLEAIKQKFFSAQDKLSVEKGKYNTEVRYFNRRTKIFPGFLIAKIFGFDKSKYFEISQNLFLRADMTFGEQG